MKPVISIILWLACCAGCDNLRLIPDPPRVEESLRNIEERVTRQAKNADEILWYDPTKTVFKFATRVRFVDGFYEGHEGVVLDWNANGYTVRVGGYVEYWNDMGLRSLKRSPMLRGVPTTSLVAVDSPPLPSSR